MSDFDAARAQLRKARELQAAARARRTAARIELRRAPSDETQATMEQARDEHADAAKAARAALEQFAGVSDPTALERFEDEVPFLLAPLRIETRFKAIAVPGEPVRHELWVRAFPDRCLVDTFEPTPTDGELAGLRAYWQQIWRAGGAEAGERAAWRALVASYGSGRAGWLVDGFPPANAGDRPVRSDDAEVILVVTTAAPLEPPDRAALETYWEARWRAGEDAGARAAALADLRAALGPGADADALVAATEPFDLADPPAPGSDRASCPLTVAFLVLAAVEETKDQSWTNAPRVELLPERLVLVLEAGGVRDEYPGEPIPSPLFTGPDPSAPAGEQLEQLDGDLRLPPELLWLADFGEAQRIGLGWAIPLSADQAEAGFDRLYVLGVRQASDADQARGELEALLADHRRSRGGLALVPQGAPTNNTEAGGSWFSRDDDPDASFDDRAGGAAFASDPDPAARRDGQWLAEALGIDVAVIAGLRHADGFDQRDARAMQTLLWPATLGYLLATLLRGILGEDAIADTRRFFTRYVSGRGAVPALRIGDQPYGVLATTAFSRIDWIARRRELKRDWSPGFLPRLLALSEVADADWAELAAGVPAVGSEGADAHATLLGILGLHPSSVEFHYRYAESLDLLFNRLNVAWAAGSFLSALPAAGLNAPAYELLQRLGYRGEGRVEFLDKYFYGSQDALKGPLIDDRPLSETDRIRSWTADGADYLTWLAGAAEESLDAVRLQDGFADKPPTALLYLLARHAILLGYDDASHAFHRSHDATPAVLAGLRAEAPFVHVARTGASESRYEPLLRDAATVGGPPGLSIAEHIRESLFGAPETAALSEQIQALKYLLEATTARLERALAEHIDTVGYRLDAWRLGFVALQLEHMRDNGPGAQTPRTGIHLGAYGWLENVRPEPRELEEVVLDPELAAVFQRPEDEPLMRDDTNGGYIHAPSPNHAVTAAILRSGYLANASRDDAEAMAVNLSSERVRMALDVLEGMRNGQSLAALLGYRLERDLHEAYAVAEADSFIYALRRLFPLHALKLKRTASDPTVAGAAIEQLEARNVVNGLALAAHVQRTGQEQYPFGLDPTDLPPATLAQQRVLSDAVGRLRNLRDAIADLALAEGVHQAAQGNFDRVGATLDAYSSGGHPPEPDVVRTPSTGRLITHRIGLQLESGLNAPADDPTPRSVAEPALNEWLGRVLPAPSAIACAAHWKDPVDGSEQSEPVTLAQLRLQPLDLLELVRTADDQAMSELDDRVVAHTLATRAPRPDARLEISYMEAGAGQTSVFAAAPAIAHARALVAAARPLRASDVAPPGAADARADANARVDRGRVAAVMTTAQQLASDAAAFALPATAGEVVAAIDDLIAAAAALLERGARLGVPGSGWGFTLLWRRDSYAETIGRLRATVAGFDARLAAIDASLADYDALPPATPEDERLRRLAAIESAISAVLDPPPATAAAGRAAVGAKRTAFAARRDAVAAVAGGGVPTLAGLLAAVRGIGPLAPFDAGDLGVAATEQAAEAFAGRLTAAVGSLHDRLAERVQAAAGALAVHDAAADAPARLAAIRAAAEALLGENFKLTEEFTLGAEQGAEWDQALQGSGELLTYLHDETAVELPVDEWLAGAARVRRPLWHLEQLGILASAAGREEPELVPIQLPHRPGERWLALEYPPDQVVDGERLLYTSVYSTAFAATAPQCGLLLDEWTEAIPGQTASTGIALNFDQPNSEPPQALLLVTPATWDGQWQWEDLLQALPDTLRLARQRAVEPAQLDATAYARFLPATITAVTRYGLTISLALAANNDVFAVLGDG